MNQQRKQAIHQVFLEQYGTEPRWWVRAPGRVDLMGSHTDYNLGYVLTLSIDRDTWIAAAPQPERQVLVYSTTIGSGAGFDLGALQRSHQARWIDYMAGVAQILQAAGYSLAGFYAVVDSTVPIGSGLSSSAALEVATATLFEVMGGWQLDPVLKAQLTQRAEVEFVGVNCGILDQYTSVMGEAGSALLLDCRDTTSTPVAIPSDISVVICDTRFKRELNGSEYDQRHESCNKGVRVLQQHEPDIVALRDVTLAQLEAHAQELDAVTMRRCRFIIEENARVLALAQALPAGDRRAIGEITQASFAGARDLYEVTCCEMESMHAAMLGAPGCIGARQAGAGFGGCLVAFVETAQREAFGQAVTTVYQQATGLLPEIYAVQPAPGAGPLT